MWQEVLSRSLPWSGARLRLRESTPDDAAFVHRMGTEPLVRRYLGGSLPYTEEETRRSLIERTGWIDSLYIVEAAPEEEPVGYAGILDNDEIGKGEIDFLIAFLPEHQNKGYGGEVLDILRERWLNEVGRVHCTASVWPENEAAVRLLQKRGFRLIGEYKDKFSHIRHVYRYDKEAAT